MVDTLPSTVTPDWDVATETEYRVNKNQFGDGYKARSVDGINNEDTSVTLVWSNLTLTEFNELKDFFDGLKGVTTFYWTPPGGVQTQYVCNKISTSFADVGANHITASLEVAYDP